MNTTVSPFLKWAGGKRWLADQYLSILPSSFNRYIEPFLGSGAIFFSLQPQKALLSDINKDLIDTYIAIKSDWTQVVHKLKEHHKNHSRDYYYKVRYSKPRTIYYRAARFIYLNRTCWNGLYRVNQKGEFNVPIGTKKNVIMESDDFLQVSKLLESVKLENKDFEPIIEEAGRGDLLFIDPPYTVKHNENGFIKYNEKLFHWDDQVRLSNCLKRAKKRGAFIILTNAYHKSIIELYRDHFNLMVAERHSIIASDPSKRKKCKELIIRN